jgi:hypothetical protein
MHPGPNARRIRRLLGGIRAVSALATGTDASNRGDGDRSVGEGWAEGNNP